MKYKLKELSNNDYSDLINMETNLLKIRGIENPNDYLHISDKYEIDYNKLNNKQNTIQEAVQCLLTHINNNDTIFTIADSDQDGVCSFAELYLYLKNQFPNINLQYAIHTAKQHGISEDIKIPNDTKLLIVTDGGSNDYEQHKILKDKGIDIIILDHHDADKISENAIVINNQLCDYPNKQLCGAGIVYKFLKALDDELWIDEADKYLDLVALGLIGDSMNVSEMETKYYIEKGLNQITNKQFKALLEKQEYYTKGVININNIAFYIVPLVNAMIRCGKQDEKQLLYKGFIEEYDEFDYKPKGKDTKVIKEDIYTRVARLCANTKSRQDKMRDKAVKEISEFIETNNKLNDKVLVINCNNKYGRNLTGVIAMKIADKYNRPCVLLNKTKDNIYRGSGRNTDRNDIKDLKQVLNDTKLFIGEGHPQAMGVVIKGNVPKGIEILNNNLKNVQFDTSYQVDFIIPFDELEDEIVCTISLLKGLWGKGLEEPLIAITDVEVDIKDINVVGKSNNTIKFNIDGLDFIKFKVKEDDMLLKLASDWNNEISNSDNYVLNIVGKCSINSWDNKPQIIISDYEIIQ